ncbi:ImmA/IrrE family metallo-endopeptidase [Spirosoma oryzicola]|uniref:ImmA/IrrE family metallo-endopeptidase n=1 Tax=Spirosoma oryzicola TaxID=2898794 RepID=UPI001E606F1A|nr:ImmA/IrrE family metallo-endopeptidase [Spirosoma oryzicola]UHG92525.1 ImmA/IrrE family metallo-endopeptidase [Spirosoma oryzicola]
MSKDKNKYYQVDRLIDGLFSQQKMGLRELFEQRLLELDLTQTKAQDLLGVQRRTLNGILDGTQKNIDFSALSRLAYFLQITNAEVIGLLLEKLEKNFPDEFFDYQKREFILNHFDLANLMKCGFLDTISDFEHIEERITSYFGLSSIYDYGKDIIRPAFSSGARKPKNEFNKNFWVESALNSLRLINNPYDYNRSKLLDFIPSIRWHSINVKKGLFQVSRDLFKLGVTVIFEDYINGIFVRGATFAVNDKPCVVLTNYSRFYPSLWFALMHELHHVLYDWDEIKANTYSPYHLSGELDMFTKNEVEADEFAREFLFPSERMNRVNSQIGNETFVAQAAKAYQIHPSIIYINYCWEHKDNDADIFAKFSKYLPDYSEAVKSIPWQSRKTVKELAKQRKEYNFNSL